MDYNLKSLKEDVEKKLKELLPCKAPSIIKKAMQYSLLAGGKRLRPLLLLSTVVSFEKDPIKFLEVACALEYIHTYSLIHDDLPSMDDDVLRRGKPTCHIKFGEAIAILAGDSLLTHSFYIFSKYPKNFPPEIKIKAVELVSEAIGAEGLVAGQVMDLQKAKKENDLINMHYLKTGKLIQLSCKLGALYSNAKEQEFKILSSFGKNFGILFQVVDDLLDELCTAEELGKSPGKDKTQGKLTAYSLWGIEGSLLKIEKLKLKILKDLKRFKGKTELFEEIIKMVLSKIYVKTKNYLLKT